MAESVEGRVEELERRVRLLEDALAAHSALAARANANVVTSAASPYRDPPPGSPPLSPTPHSMETRVGMRWFNRLGALTVLVGLLLGASWASRHGYLGPRLRLLLAAAAAVAIFRAGARALGAPEIGRRTVGLGVAIVGAAALYLVPWAAAHVDQVIDARLAALLGVGVTGAIAWLAWQREERAHAFLAAAGGLAVPLLGYAGEGSFAALWAWLTLLVVGALLVVRGGGRGRVFAGVSIVLAPGATALLVGALFAARTQVDAAGLTVRALACAATLVGIWAARVEALAAGRAVSRLDDLAAHLAMAGAALVAIVVAVITDVPGLTAAGLALLALMSGGAALARRSDDVSGHTTATWFAGAQLYALPVPLFAGLAHHGLVLAIAAIAATGAVLARRGAWRTGQMLALATLGFAAMLVPLGLSGDTGDAGVSGREAIEWLAVAGAGFVLARVERGRGAGLLATIVAHAALVTLLLRLGAGGGGAPVGGGFRLWSTLVPLGYGLAALAAGVLRRSPATRGVGLLLLLGAIAKVFVVDVWVASEGVRVAAFLVLGATLLAASFLYSRLADRLADR